MKGFLIGLVVLIAIGLGAWALGWISFGKDPATGDAEAKVHTQKIEQDVDEAVETTKDTLNSAVESTKEAVE